MIPTRQFLVLAACLCLLFACVAAAPQSVTTPELLESMSLEELEEQLQVHTPTPSTDKAP